MSNRSKLEALSTKEYVVTIKVMLKHPFINYIDLESYLDSDNDNITDFIKHHGKCRIKPSEMELKDNPNAEGLNNALLLDTTTMMGTEYAVVADLKNARLLKTPMANVVLK